MIFYLPREARIDQRMEIDYWHTVLIPKSYLLLINRLITFQADDEDDSRFSPAFDKDRGGCSRGDHDELTPLVPLDLLFLFLWTNGLASWYPTVAEERSRHGWADCV
jgi:hypothetical protein